ncbi:hypothetical protein GQ53DRAFT_832356 [Thozetella sp. PMI_491]|nr:hypothetical protein GQ53DRAFT_832356 [Thozetella sp. PMI_491]
MTESRHHADDMRAHLVRLPGELLEIVLENLDLANAKNLRLTCRALQHKCLGPCFGRSVEHQTTDLCGDSLQRLQELARHPVFGRMVKRLTVLAAPGSVDHMPKPEKAPRRATPRPTAPGSTALSPPAPLTDELPPAAARPELEPAQPRKPRMMECRLFNDAVDKLAEAFRAFGALQSIDLEDGPSIMTHHTNVSYLRVLMSYVGARAYHIIMLAVTRSRLRIASLNLYGPAKFCSVSVFELMMPSKGVEIADFEAVGPHIKSFALTMSTRGPASAAGIEQAVAEPRGVFRLAQELFNPRSLAPGAPESWNSHAEDMFATLPRLLQHLPNLEALDLRLRNEIKDNPRQNYKKLFLGIARDVHCPELRRLSLRGLCVTQDSLLQLLLSHRKLSKVEFRHVFLVQGTWAYIFGRLAEMPAVKRVQLSGIWELSSQTDDNTLEQRSIRLINLDPVDRLQGRQDNGQWRSYPCSNGSVIHTNEFSRDDLLKGLNFRPKPTGHPLGSVQLYHWQESTRDVGSAMPS